MKFLTLKNLFAFALLFGAFVSQGQTVIWGAGGTLGKADGEFDGGFNGWTTEGVSGTPVDSALWEWMINPSPVRGAYGKNLSAINSPTKTNGGVIFDSDYLDNAGIAGNFGNGKCAAPHKSYLTSPVIDLSANPFVALQFYQYYRNFETVTNVEISNDNGVTWNAIQVNATIAGNNATPNPDRQVINISQYAGGFANVQVRFNFDGTGGNGGSYYFWIIDDVSIITLPDNDLSVDESYFGPSNALIPQAHQSNESIGFSAKISNRGSQAQNDVVLNVSVIDTKNGNNVVYKDSLVIPTVAAGTLAELHQLTNTFVPTSLVISDYQIVYNVSARGLTDFNPTDNKQTKNFSVTDFIFGKATTLSGGNRPATLQDHEWATLYTIAPSAIDTVYFGGMRFGMTANDGDPQVQGKTIPLYLAEWADLEDTLDQTLPIGDGVQSIKLAVSDYTFAANYAQGSMVLQSDANFYDLGTGNQLENFALEPGKTYSVSTACNGANNTFFTMCGANQYKSQDLADDYRIENLIWFGNTQQLGFFSAVVAATQLILKVKTIDVKVLPDSYVSAFPNPASNRINVALNYNKPLDTEMFLTDINGVIVKMVKKGQVHSENLSFDTSDLASGTYFLRVATTEGTKTSKVVIVK